MFIGLNQEINPTKVYFGADKVIHDTEVFLGIFIGAITFTGSVVAYGKLAGSITGKAVILPGRHLLNILMVVVCLVLGWMYLNDLVLAKYLNQTSASPQNLKFKILTKPSFTISTKIQLHNLYKTSTAK